MASPSAPLFEEWCSVMRTAPCHHSALHQGERHLAKKSREVNTGCPATAWPA